MTDKLNVKDFDAERFAKLRTAYQNVTKKLNEQISITNKMAEIVVEEIKKAKVGIPTYGPSKWNNAIVFNSHIDGNKLTIWVVCDLIYVDITTLKLDANTVKRQILDGTLEDWAEKLAKSDAEKALARQKKDLEQTAADDLNIYASECTAKKLKEKYGEKPFGLNVVVVQNLPLEN